LTRCAWVLGQLPTDGSDMWVPARETLPAEYRRLQAVEGEPILTVVRQDPAKSHLTVTTHPAQLKNFPVLRARVEWQFHLEASLHGFYRQARRHPALQPILKNLYGVKPLRPPTLYEMAVIAVSEQQLSYPVAVRMRSRLVRALGKKMVLEGKEYRAFPDPQSMAERKVQDLRALSFSTRKAEYILGLSREVARGGLDLEALRDRSNEEVVQTLTSLRGFGRWSAEYFLSRGVGRGEVVPADDLGIQTLVGKYLGPGRRVTEKECRNILEEWGPYKRWVVFYLFLATRLGLVPSGRE
jgi:DNA-3-methyladenine glycosylase II